MKNLLIILLAFSLVNCEFQAKSFTETGGILYTLKLPENTSQTDSDELQAILKKRIASYVRQKPTFDYDKEKQQLLVGVPKSLTSKNPDLCRKLLLADGSFLMVRSSKDYLSISEKLIAINENLKKNPIEIDGKLSEQYLFDVLEVIPSQNMMPFLGISSISDTGLVMKMIKDERFQSKFSKDLIWVWKVKKQEMKAYLHAYSNESLKVHESTIAAIKIDNSMDNYPALSLTFDKIGTEQFKKITTEAAPVRGLVHMFVSQELVLSPTVQTPIEGGKVQITGDNMEEVIFMESIIKAGRLPVDIELISEVGK